MVRHNAQMAGAARANAAPATPHANYYDLTRAFLLRRDAGSRYVCLARARRSRNVQQRRFIVVRARAIERRPAVAAATSCGVATGECCGELRSPGTTRAVIHARGLACVRTHWLADRSRVSPSHPAGHPASQSPSQPASRPSQMLMNAFRDARSIGLLE